MVYYVYHYGWSNRWSWEYTAFLITGIILLLLLLIYLFYNCFSTRRFESDRSIFTTDNSNTVPQFNQQNHAFPIYQVPTNPQFDYTNQSFTMHGPGGQEYYVTPVTSTFDSPPVYSEEMARAMDRTAAAAQKNEDNRRTNTES